MEMDMDTNMDMENTKEFLDEIRENVREIYGEDLTIREEEQVEKFQEAEIEEAVPSAAMQDNSELTWQARTGLSEDSLCGAIETLIFMCEKPLSLIKLKLMIDKDMPLKTIHDAIIKLQEEYDKSYHGLRLVEVAEGYQFRTRPAYAKFIQRMFKVSSLVLTPTALEVLAIIAYRGPLSRTEIDKVRGVDSSHIVRALMDKRLVKILKRDEDLGRSVLYATTDDFLELFNLKSLQDLPPEFELESIAKVNEIGTFSDIRTMVKSNVEGTFYKNDLEELDLLDQGLKSIAVETPFLQTLRQENKITAPIVPDAPPPPAPRSAFELLEEFISRDEVAKQNKEASLCSLSPQDLQNFMFEIPQVIETIKEEENLTPEQEETVWFDEEFEDDQGEDDSQVDETIVEQVVQDAKDLDIDLSFLRKDT